MWVEQLERSLTEVTVDLSALKSVDSTAATKAGTSVLPKADHLDEMMV